MAAPCAREWVTPPLSGYTPCGHPLVPTAEVQSSLERFNGSHWVRPATDECSSADRSACELFTRDFPVERTFFDTFVVPCVDRTTRLPSCAEPKFACGAWHELDRRNPTCHVWSFGSAGETCFEETVHMHAPGCRISVFDPTIRASDPRLERPIARGAFDFSQVGLGDVDAQRRFRGYGSQPATRGVTRTLASLMIERSVEWIDYLKIDCERCELDALPRFINDSLARWGHVPVTQLQVEVHVSQVDGSHNQTHLRTHSYGKYGLVWKNRKSRRDNATYYSRGGPDEAEEALKELSMGGLTNNPHSMAWNSRARKLLASLYGAGFVAFHIDLWGDRADPFLGCCFAEYTLLNTRAPTRRLPLPPHFLSAVHSAGTN